jgi:putative addiction module component (TIGR02574 family)
MSQSTQALESAALLLPAEERARLAERLLASLDVDPAIEEAWATEIERRLADWEAGLVEGIPWSEARQQIQAKLGSR